MIGKKIDELIEWSDSNPMLVGWMLVFFILFMLTILQAFE